MLLPFGCDGWCVLVDGVSGNSHNQARQGSTFRFYLTPLLHRLGGPSNVLRLFGRQPRHSRELSLLVRIQSHLEGPERLAGRVVVCKQCPHPLVILRYRLGTGILGLAIPVLVLVNYQSYYPREQVNSGGCLPQVPPDQPTHDRFP